MAETDHHRILMNDLIQTLDDFYKDDPMVYVFGNLLVFYVPGDKRRHLAPDVFVVKGVPKHNRLNYLVWEERKGPDIVIELTSSSTRSEDTKKKFHLYQDTLRVPEYFLFDPYGDYLDPPFQGYRLRQAHYVPIKLAHGRMPSKILGLHLEQRGPNLRLIDPENEKLLLTPLERVNIAEFEQQRAELALQRTELARDRAEFETERLLREIADLRRNQGSAK
jgi:Uma2 family endonuclease